MRTFHPDVRIVPYRVVGTNAIQEAFLEETEESAHQWDNDLAIGVRFELYIWTNGRSERDVVVDLSIHCKYNFTVFAN